MANFLMSTRQGGTSLRYVKPKTKHQLTVCFIEQIFKNVKISMSEKAKKKNSLTVESWVNRSDNFRKLLICIRNFKMTILFDSIIQILGLHVEKIT